MKKLRRTRRLQQKRLQQAETGTAAMRQRPRIFRNPLSALLAAQLLFAAPVFAAPQGGQVTSGSATINQAGATHQYRPGQQQGDHQLAELRDRAQRNRQLQPARQQCGGPEPGCRP